MKRFYIFLVFGIFLIFLNSFSQTTIRIIDIKGEVLVKISPTQPWEKARVNMPLNKETEIQTKINSECTIGFDTDLRNVLTLKENSQVKVEEILPAKVFLSKGRVFSLIKDVATLKEFKVRTPVAIAGVKGTGFSVDSSESGSVIKCFEDKVDVTGLDNQGNPTQEAELLSGFGINVDLEGNLGDVFLLGSEDWKEWSDFRNTAEEERREDTTGGDNLESNLENLEEERKDNQKDTISEETRREESPQVEEEKEGYGEKITYPGIGY